MAYRVNIDKEGLVRERSLVLDRGEDVNFVFAGSGKFSIEFRGQNPFDTPTINSSQPTAKNFKYVAQDLEYWDENPLKGFPYEVFVNDIRTDPPSLAKHPGSITPQPSGGPKHPGPITPQQSGGQKPPGPIILPPPTCPTGK